MKHVTAFVLALMLASRSFSQSADEIAIIAILDRQATAWNEGSLEKFMEAYWKSDSLVFVSKTGITYGYEKVLARYREAYPDKEAMGRLALRVIQVRRLAADSYFVVGKYQLERAAGNAEGHFTLLLRKINGRWKAVVDHSS